MNTDIDINVNIGIDIDQIITTKLLIVITNNN